MVLPGSPTISRWHYPLILELFYIPETPPIKQSNKDSLISYFI